MSRKKLVTAYASCLFINPQRYSPSTHLIREHTLLWQSIANNKKAAVGDKLIAGWLYIGCWRLHRWSSRAIVYSRRAHSQSFGFFVEPKWWLGVELSGRRQHFTSMFISSFHSILLKLLATSWSLRLMFHPLSCRSGKCQNASTTKITTRSGNSLPSWAGHFWLDCTGDKAAAHYHREDAP